MGYYPEPDSHITNIVKVVLEFSNYTTKKDEEHAASVGTSDLVAKNLFIDKKASVEKLVIAKLVDVSTSLNNLKTKVDDLDIGKLKNVPRVPNKLNDI